MSLLELATLLALRLINGIIFTKNNKAFCFYTIQSVFISLAHSVYAALNFV